MTALYSLYRSQRFDELVGQDALVRTLKNALRGGRISHAYLFSGIRGTGKTSAARILARAVNCENPQDGEPCNVCPSCVGIRELSATDLIEIDAASNRGVDEMRDLREKAKYLPAQLKRKVYIIDEAHQLTIDAFNALLKTLEEPPEHVLFILCTTEAHKLPATVVGRCQRFEFRRISEEDIAARLAFIAGKEKIEYSGAGLRLVASMAQGSLRDAITMLDQLASAGAETIDDTTVRKQLGLASGAELAAILGACARGDASEALRDLGEMVERGADLRQLSAALAETARRVALVELGAITPAAAGGDDGGGAYTSIVQGAPAGFGAAAFELGLNASTQMKQAADPRLVLELLLVKTAALAGVRDRGAARGPAAAAAPPAAKTEPAPPAAAGDAAAPAVVADAPVEPRAAPYASAPSSQPEAAATQPVDSALEPILSRWGGMGEALRGTASAIRVGALLADATPFAIDDDLLTLAFRYAIHSEKAQEPSNRQELEAALRTVYGRTFRLQFKVDAEIRPTKPGPRGGSSVAAASPGARPADDAEPLVGDAVAQAAVEILGARITDVRPRRRVDGTPA